MSAKINPVAFDRWLQKRILDQLGDAVLLERFHRHGDGAAFAVLVERHGPLVRSVCARMLTDPHDRDDAFQATFLVLVQRAGSIRQGDSLAGWLFAVARRTAGKARRRPAAQAIPEEDPPAREARAAFLSDERAFLHEELGRLPDRYRLPLLLCGIEGQTVEQAALRLGWPKGSVAGRLARGKELLRRRLERRGVAAASVLGLESLLASEACAVAAASQAACVAAAVALRAGATAQISPSVLALMKGVTVTMFWKQTGLVLGVLVLCGGMGGGLLRAAWSGGPIEPGAVAAATSAPHSQPPAAAQPAGPRDEPGEAVWWILLRKGNDRQAFHPETGKTTPLPPVRILQYDQQFLRGMHMDLGESTPINGALSPDGKRLAFLGDVAGGKAQPHPFHGHIVLSDPDGGKPLIVTESKANYSDLAWSPDGKRLAFDEPTENKQRLANDVKDSFDYGEETMRRVRVMDVASGRTLFTFGGNSESIHSPQFTPHGRLSYLVTRGRSGKMLLNDIVVRILDGTMSVAALRPVTVVERQIILGWAFSPDADESRIAYAVPGTMVIKGLTEAGNVFYTMDALNSKHQKGWRVVFAEPFWRPDGKQVASRCAFLGGRAVGFGGADAEPPAIPGEDLLVVFEADLRAVHECEPTPYHIDRKWDLVGWVQGKELPKREN